MKWLAEVLKGVFVAFLVAILLAIFQDPISQYFRGDRLEAWVELGPWMARPGKAGDTPLAALTESGFAESWAKDLAEKTDAPTFARVTVSNKTRSIVKNIRIRFPSPYTPDAFAQGADGNWSLQDDVHELTLPDLSPGEQRFVYLWEPLGLNSYSLNDIESYSSVGPMRMTFSAPELLGDTTRKTDFDRFMDDWLPIILFVLGALLLMGLGIMLAAWSTYAKQLLKAEDFYNSEKAKFEQAPDKFQPDWAGPTKA